MSKKYNPVNEEETIRTYWHENQIYQNGKGTPYKIDTPPPTVSGRMHLGHAFSYIQGDIIARHKRMQGYNVIFPFGTDDNGLPTEKLVEKTKKLNSKNIPKKDFIQICRETIKEVKPDFIQDWKDIGMSCDFSNSYSTIDHESVKEAQKSFIELYNKGIIYKEESPSAWCTKTQTGIAQAEFESVEMTSSFNDIIFDCKGQELIISTTRPELIPACVALAAHPTDERYQKLKGKFASTPITGHEVPIIFDEDVEKDKGSGLMMICTFGDKEDIVKWRRHKLTTRPIIKKDGTLNSLAGPYQNLTVRDARKKIIEDLTKKNILIKSEKIKHFVNIYERSGQEIEYIITKQWFVKVLNKKQELLTRAENINWHPNYMKKRYIHWVENLNWDWCISRQRSFGVPIPMLTDEKGNDITAEIEELPFNPENNKNVKLKPDEDVLDTWFTSGLTPILFQKKLDTNLTFPVDLRLQAHDIIRTWAFYTITHMHNLKQSEPWKNIMISGFVLDPKGNKMSKSKGNGIKPQELLNQYGADPIRYWAASSKLGEDIPFQEKELQAAKKLINKLWNASKFVFMQLEGYAPRPINKDEIKTIDKWLLGKLNQTVNEATKAYDEFEYFKARSTIDNFFWKNYCDNYLEFVKTRTYNDPNDESATYTLYYGLLTILKLYAPIIPHITEKIYQDNFKTHESSESIHQLSYPPKATESDYTQSIKAGDIAVNIAETIRKYKSDNGVSLKEPLAKLLIKGKADTIELINLVQNPIKDVGHIQTIELEQSDEYDIKITK